MKVNGETTEDNRDAGLLSNPLSFLRSGYFVWYNAGLYARGGSGNYWSLRSGSTTSSNYLDFYNTSLYLQYHDSHGFAFAVHYVYKSFTTLINTSYSMKDYTQTSENNQDSGILSNPLSLLRNGIYGGTGGSASSRGDLGLFWLLRSIDISASYDLSFSNTNLGPQYSANRGMGLAVRCEIISHKSFTTLINTSYSMKNYSETSSTDSSLLSNPLSFLRSGYFDWNGAGLGNRGNYGDYWTLRSNSANGSSDLLFYNTYLYLQGNDVHGFGFAVRCVPTP